MKIEFNLVDLMKAYSIVGVVTPAPIPNGSTGYLFVVRGDTCFLYSNGEMAVARSSFPLISSEEDGSFVYPAEYMSAFGYLGEETCSMEITCDTDGKYLIKYTTSSGAESERSSFDPLMLSVCDKDLEKAISEGSHTFQPGILREAINQAKPFLGKIGDPKVADNFQGLQIMDALSGPEAYKKADGYLYVTDGVRIMYVYSDEFRGKSLEIHGRQLGLFTNFLGKCGAKVTLHKSNTHTFAVSESGDILGWPRHSRLHEKFNYYSLTLDTVIVRTSKVRLLAALQHTRKELESNLTKIRVHFDPSTMKMWFSLSEGSAKAKSISVTVEATFQSKDSSVEPTPTPFSVSVNIDHFIELVNHNKNHEIVLRCMVADKNKKQMALFRTVDEYYLDSQGKLTVEPEGAFKCQTTRFISSRD